MASSVSGSVHKGEIYAVIEQPFGVVGKALARLEHWCDILVLQVNVKRCGASVSSRSRPTDSLAAPADERLDGRLRNWYAAISRYPQLHEQVGADEYVAMKRKEAS
ncbi:MAG TPA: hypothetical protein VFR66_12255 [Burkholderiales bacterium]|nr:hypothetical protein [Burkholderiales bacterium]